MGNPDRRSKGARHEPFPGFLNSEPEYTIPACSTVNTEPHETALDECAYLDRRCKISGKLVFEGAARIDGQIDGEVVARESLIIGESAVLTPQIIAASIIVEGRVTGDVSASERVEIRSLRVHRAAPARSRRHRGANLQSCCAATDYSSPWRRSAPH